MGQEESEVVVLHKKPLMEMFEEIRSISSVEWTDKALSELHESVIYRSANLSERNDDGQTPLDVARFGESTGVDRLIMRRCCFFSGCLMEIYGSVFCGVLAPKLPRKIWAVVFPRVPYDPAEPPKMELAIYLNFEDAQPHNVVALWEANIDEPKLNRQDPTLLIFDRTTGTCYEFAASDDEDKQQLQSFYEACKGISPDLNRRGVHESEPAESNPENTYVVPSAPPIPIIDEGKVEYRPIESHVNFSAPYVGNEKAGTNNQGKDEDVPSYCVTCLETLVEGACVPCGHMAGCVACLDEINTKNWVCPVCGTKIDQVIKIYAV